MTVEVECPSLLPTDNTDNPTVKYGASDEYTATCAIGRLNGRGCVTSVEAGSAGKVLGCHNSYSGGNCTGICTLWTHKENTIELETSVLSDESTGCRVKECEVGEGPGDPMACVGTTCLASDLVCDPRDQLLVWLRRFDKTRKCRTR